MVSTIGTNDKRPDGPRPASHGTVRHTSQTASENAPRIARLAANIGDRFETITTVTASDRAAATLTG